MKKTITIILLSAMFLGACTQYTCPTYASQKKASTVKQSRY